jgi:regulator of protease activity HflC (stomatin/prohibitin superfamily)
MENSPEISSVIIILNCIALFIIMVIISASLRIIPEKKRIQVYRLGRYIGEKGPGVVLLMPIIDKGILIDILDQITSVNKQTEYFGVIGKTITPVHTDGKAIFNDETMNAISKDPIPADEKVRIVKVVVEVEKIFTY